MAREKPFMLFALFVMCIWGAYGAAEECQFLPIDEIKPGMKGYGKTVFQGDKIERFEAEIISVVKNTQPKGDMILARLSGGPLKEAGLIAGMSGSPVYVDDKIIGAVAYGWVFAKEPIAGITPIEEMLRVEDEVGKTPQPASANFGPGPADVLFTDALLPLPPVRGPQLELAGMRPLPIPVMIRGGSAHMLRLLEPSLEAFNMFPVAGGAPAGAANVNPPFEAGAAMGVQLVRGDVDMVGVGTLTYRKGNKVLGFGHPMLQCGETDLPMVSAYVHTVIATQNRSFKVAGSVAQVGRISEDRRAAIGGEIGQFAKMIPCAISVVDARAKKEHSYHYEMLHQRMLTPLLLSALVAESIGATEGVMGDYMVNISSQMKLVGRPTPITMENLYYESTGLDASLMEMVQKAMVLMNNPFEPVRIESFNIKATVHPGRKTATIESIVAEKRVLQRGEKARLVVNLKPYKSEHLVPVPFEVELPLATPEGKPIMVAATDAATARQMDRNANPGAFRPETFQQLFALLQRQDHNCDLVLRVTLPNTGVSMRGETFPNLPPSVMNILAFGNQSSARPAANEIVIRRRTDWALSGSQSLSLVIKQEK